MKKLLTPLFLFALFSTASFSMEELSQSTVGMLKEAHAKEYNTIKSLVSSGDKCLLEILMENYSHSQDDWNTYIKDAIDDKILSHKDIIKIIENKFTDNLDFILRQLTIEQRYDHLKTVFLESYINKTYGYATRAAGAFRSHHSTNEQWNLLAWAVEKYHLDAFDMIITAWPNKDFLTLACTKRSELTQERSYKNVIYNLTTWLARSREADRYCPKINKKNYKNYMSAGKIILAKVVALEIKGENKKDGSLLRPLFILFSHIAIQDDNQDNFKEFVKNISLEYGKNNRGGKSRGRIYNDRCKKIFGDLSVGIISVPVLNIITEAINETTCNLMKTDWEKMKSKTNHSL